MIWNFFQNLLEFLKITGKSKSRLLKAQLVVACSKHCLSLTWSCIQNTQYSHLYCIYQFLFTKQIFRYCQSSRKSKTKSITMTFLPIERLLFDSFILPSIWWARDVLKTSLEKICSIYKRKMYILEGPLFSTSLYLHYGVSFVFS